MTDAYRPEEDELDRAISRLQRQRTQQTRQNYLDPLLPNPEEAAKARRLSEISGLPEPEIQANPGQGEAAAAALLADQHLQSSPRLRDWINDPRNAAVARDDIQNLSIFERLASGYFRAAAGRTSSAEGQQAADVLGLFGTINPLAAPLAYPYLLGRGQSMFGGDPLGNEQGRQGELDVEFGKLAYRSQQQARGNDTLTDEDRARLDELATREGQDNWGPFLLGPTRRLIPQVLNSFEQGAEQAVRRADEAWDDPFTLREGERWTARRVLEGGVAASIEAPATLVATFGGAAGGYLGAGYEMETGIAFDAMVRQGIDPNIAAERAEQYGATATAIEFASDALGIRISGATRLATRALLAERVLAERPALRAAEGIIGTGLEQGTEEALQEYAQIIHQDLAAQDQANGGDGSSRVRWSEVLTPEHIQQILQAGYIGAQGGLGMGSIPGAANYALDMRAVSQADRAAQVFEQWTLAAQASRLNERGLASTMESAVGAMDQSNVYIDAERFVEHFQSAGVSPYAVADELGIGEQGLAQALAAHGQVEIPTARFAARVLRIPAHARLAEHTRIAPDAATPAEAQADAQRIQAEVERVAGEMLETAQSDNELGQVIETRMRELFAAAQQEGGPRAEVSARYARLAAALPRALVARARATNPEYAAKLEQQFRTLFGERLDVAGPGRELGAPQGAEVFQRGKGPDAGPVRNDAWSPPEGVRISERARKIAEMAVNGASNEWIAEEMGVTRQNVSVTLDQVKNKLGGTAPWESAPSGSDGRPAKVQLDRLVHARDQAIASGYPKSEIIRMLAERYDMEPNNVKQRLWQHDRKKKKAQAEADAQNRRAQPFDLHTVEGRQAWFEESVIALPVPGEAADARFYGFALDTGEIIVATIAPEPTGSTTVDWTFLDRLKAAATDEDVDLFGPGAERLGVRGVSALMARVAAVLEGDVAQFGRDSYVYTPNNEALEYIYERLVSRIVGKMPYSTTSDNAGAFYLIRDGAEVLRNGTVVPSPENANAPRPDWPNLAPEEVKRLQAETYDRIERFAKEGADGRDRGDGGQANADGASADAGGRVSGARGTGEGELKQGDIVDRAHEEGYGGADTGEAAEWLSAVAKGLPMDEASRMARAKEMGFDVDTPLYHGSPDIEGMTEFRRGRGYGGGSAGVWFSDDPSVASEYAASRGNAPGVVSAYARGRTLDLTDPVEAGPALARVWENMKDDWADEFEYRAQLNGTTALNEFVDRVTSGDIWDTGDTKLSLQNDLLDWLAGEYDAVRIGDSVGGVSNTSTVVFDPTNIRSRFAAFDPDQKDSANLLAQEDAKGSIRYQGFDAGQFGSALIRLGQTSDLSTFLHEFGHLGHLVLESMATDPQAPVEIRAMWEQTLGWWGIDQAQWAALSELRYTPFDQIPASTVARITAQFKQLNERDPSRGEVEQIFAEQEKTARQSPYFEQWARAFEGYLMEGKAPSLSLREAFETFKQWLTQIYRSVLRLNANLSPQIRDVFDRLLATDQEIAEARAAMGADFALSREAFKTDEEFQQYQSAISQAKEAQEAELRARAMDAYARKSKRWWRGERERVRDAATRAVDSDPARRVEQWVGLQDWRTLPDTLLSDEGEIGYTAPEGALEDMPEGLPAMQLSPEAIAQDWPNAVLPTSLQPRTDVEAVLSEAMALKAQTKGRGQFRAQRLARFIKDNGGINLSSLNEEQRAQFDGIARKRPGLINNATGKTPEELMRLATEAGYFGEGAARELKQGPNGPDAGHAGAGRLPPFEFDANEFSSRMAFPRDVPEGPASVHATSMAPTYMQPGNTRFGNSGTKFVTVNGEPVARAEITQAADGGPVTVQLIQTVDGAQRRGYARQLLDDLYAEFGPFHTTAQSQDGSALFANYVRQADGTYRPAPQSPDGGAGRAVSVSELRSRFDPFGQDNPWEVPQITEAEVRRAMAQGKTETRRFDDQGPDWTRQDHINRIATLAREGWDQPIDLTSRQGVADGVHRLAAAIIRGDETIATRAAADGAFGWGDVRGAHSGLRVQRDGARWQVVDADGAVVEQLPQGASFADAERARIARQSPNEGPVHPGFELFQGGRQIYYRGRAADRQMRSSRAWFTEGSPDVASSYAEQYANGHVAPYYLDLGRTLEIDVGGAQWNRIPLEVLPKSVRDAVNAQDFRYGVTTNELSEISKAQGYDSLRIRNVRDRPANNETAPLITIVSLSRAVEGKNVHPRFNSAAAGFELFQDPVEAVAEINDRVRNAPNDVPRNVWPPGRVGVAFPKADPSTRVSAREATEDGEIQTSWATLQYRAGRDMIVGEAQGDVRPVRRDIFDMTYEEVAPGEFAKRSDVPVGYWIADREQVIRTLEGDVTAQPGDYVMIGAIGEMWPIKPEKFAQRYDVPPVPQPASDKLPTVEEFLATLIADLRNERQVYSARDAGALASAQALADAQEWFDAHDIDLSKGKEEIRAQIVSAIEKDRASENQWAPDDIAPWFGFSSGDELIQALSALKPRNVAIEEEIDRRLNEEHGDAGSPEKVQEAARMAAHAAVQANRIELELAALQAATGGRKTPVGNAARAYAERQVNLMTVKQVRNPDVFLAGERRAARNAMEAAEKGDTQNAALWKQRQLISFHLYRFARDAAEEMDKAQSYFQKFDRDTIRAKIHPPLMDQIDQALEGVDLRAKPRISDRKRQGFLSWFNEMQAEGLEHMVMVDPEFMEEVRQRPFNSLTLEDARAMRDAVRNFEHIGRRWRELLAARDARLLDEEVALMAANMAEVKPFELANAADHSPGLIESIDIGRQKFHATLSRVEFVAFAMDGHRYGGPVQKGLIQPMRDARGREEMRQEAAQQAIEGLFSVYTDKERADMWTVRRFYPQVPNRDGSRMGRNFTKQEILALALNTGNEYNWNALLQGEAKTSRATESQIRALLDAAMDRRDWEFVQSVWDYVDSFWPEIEALYRQTTGVAPPKVQATPFQNRHGEWRGGYYHLQYDFGRDQRAREEFEFGRVQEAFGGFRLRTQTPNGFAKARQGSGGRPVLLDLSVLTEHVNGVVHDLEFRVPVLNAWRLIKHGGFRDAFVRAAGQAQYDQLKPWLQYIATERMPPENIITGSLKLLRQNTPIALMGYSVSTVVQQPAGLLGTMHRLGPARVMGKLAETAARPWTWMEMGRFINSRSTFMRNRTRISQREIREMVAEINSENHINAVNLLFAGNVRQKAEALAHMKRVMGRYALWPLAFVDKIVSSVPWTLAYEDAIAGRVENVNPQNEKEAVDYADHIIATTFGSGRPEDLPAIMRANELGKLITPAFSYFSTQYNQLFNEQMPGMMRGKISVMEFMTYITLALVVQQLVSTWAAGRWNDDGEDDEERARRLAAEVVITPLAGVPIVRDIARGVAQQVATGRKPRGDLVPAFGAITSTTQAVGGTIEAVGKGEDIDRTTMRAIVMSGGYWLGLPSNAFWRLAEGTTDIATGEDDLSDPAQTASELLLRDSQ